MIVADSICPSWLGARKSSSVGPAEIVAQLFDRFFVGLAVEGGKAVSRHVLFARPNGKVTEYHGGEAKVGLFRVKSNGLWGTEVGRMADGRNPADPVVCRGVHDDPAGSRVISFLTLFPVTSQQCGAIAQPFDRTANAHRTVVVLFDLQRFVRRALLGRFQVKHVHRFVRDGGDRPRFSECDDRLAAGDVHVPQTHHDLIFVGDQRLGVFDVTFEGGAVPKVDRPIVVDAAGPRKHQAVLVQVVGGEPVGDD